MSIHSHRRTKAVGTLPHGGQLTCAVSLGRRISAADNSSLRSSAKKGPGIATLINQVTTLLQPGKPSRSAFLVQARTMGPSSNTPDNMSMHVARSLPALVSPTPTTLPRERTTVRFRSPYTRPATMRPLSCLNMSILAIRCGTIYMGRKPLSRRCTTTFPRIGRSRIAGSSERTPQRILRLKLELNADAQKWATALIIQYPPSLHRPQAHA